MPTRLVVEISAAGQACVLGQWRCRWGGWLTRPTVLLLADGRIPTPR